ncbi:fungal zn(2)-Cys(6) binuclear cluster domain-containing protein [Trichoderma breve]|uniref:Fungal zn(2)-Cys(6) binuclear cluster domain-containing protein n=1 Tax=Trichoderma breve TaxID=2034170 RepID=A0A9W9BK65_9HYPO|nr:fungal zn(2)-Cys(6) binuclear cluster domain-containing protein [Trichoderma breve]KAJ4861358.1 fungal zn(2)-Cys(6) binuclear cluster domain-containing protein [Trichoderma breve]
MYQGERHLFTWCSFAYEWSEADPLLPSASPPELHVSLGNNNDKQTGLVKNRQRAQLSCIRCHRLKVKCDKELPCSRCRMSGWGKSCAYHHRAEKTSPSNASPQQVAKDPDSVIEAWHSQSRSATHWTEVLSTLKLQAGRSGLQVCDLIPDFIRQQKMGAQDDYLVPENFPFNSPAAAKFTPMDAVQDLLQRHRENYQSYIDGYLVLYQTSHPIIDTSAFLPLVETFWNDPKAADMAWLASFLMVLALGCFAVTRDQHATIELCMAAEACLGKTPFMVQPDMLAIRTLCLMILAKQTVSTTCRTFDSCWTLLGIVTRAAVGMDLHKQRVPLDQSREGIRAWQSSQTLWSIIVYFCVQVATITGKPLLVSADMFTKHSSPSTFQTNDPWPGNPGAPPGSRRTKSAG